MEEDHSFFKKKVLLTLNSFIDIKMKITKYLVKIRLKKICQLYIKKLQVRERVLRWQQIFEIVFSLTKYKFRGLF